MRRIHADLLLLACAAVWGFAFLFQKAAMAHVGPLLFVAARGLVAGLVLAPLAFVEHRRPETPLLERRLVTVSVLAGCAFTMGAFLQQSGLRTALVTNAGFLTALYVVAVPFTDRALTGRTIELPIWGAVALSFLGVWLLGGGTLGSFAHGDLLVAASSLFWALHVVLIGKAAPLGRPFLVTALQFLVVGTLSLAGALLLEPVSISGLRAAAVDIFYVGVLSGALTFSVFTFALRTASPAEAAVIVSAETLFAALGASLFLGERLSAIGALGAAAILVAIGIVQIARTRQA